MTYLKLLPRNRKHSAFNIDQRTVGGKADCICTPPYLKVSKGQKPAERAINIKRRKLGCRFSLKSSVIKTQRNLERVFASMRNRAIEA